MRNRMAVPDRSVTERERKNVAISTQIAVEGIVLLENKGVLPLSKNTKTIALFGSGARRTVKGGTGSGDVNTRDYVTVEQGLKNAGFQIVTDAWLSAQETAMLRAKKEYDDHIQELSHQGISVALLTMMGKPFKEPEFREIQTEELASADAAIYVLARNSGEGADRKVVPGDYLLTDTECRDIELLAKTYDRFVLLLNVGGVVDIECVRELPGAVVLMSQGGSGCGDAVAKVLTGEVNPSGRLTATWAKRYADYPFAADYCAEPDDAVYKEGVFVGYRWFDSFDIQPRYPFGYGMSYTEFAWNTQRVTVQGDQVTVTVSVTNTGSIPGKEVVQIFASQPQTEMSKAAKVLAGFHKTDLILPGATETVKVSFPVQQLASYDASKSAWVLEKGEYGIYVGRHSGHTELVAALTLDKTVVTERCKALFRQEQVDEIVPEIAPVTYECPKVPVDAKALETVEHTYAEQYSPLPAPGKPVTFRDVVSGAATAEELVGQMTADELALLCIGAARVSITDFSVIGNASRSIPGAAGDTTDRLSHYGLPQCAMADGPAGIRVNPKVYQRGDTYINNVDEDPILGKVLPPELRKVDLSGTEVKYQYCTALPVAVQIAQTWNPKLAELAGDVAGSEMDELGIDLWLAPGMNIHRNPLCGRNFEYYSEDPYLSGAFAAAVTCGVQKHPGKGTCIKHLAVNNQETNRSTSNSHVSERALREIYLKGFEICVKEAQPLSAMTSMNLLNGIHTANDPDLLIHALRDEWGFEGIVMTDWGVTGSFVNIGEKRKYGPATPIGCILAGNDLIMPGTKFDEDTLMAAAQDGSLPIHNLQDCAVRIVKLLVKCWPAWKDEKMEIYAVKMGGLNDPVGFDFTPLLCSWKVRGNDGKKQQWAGIQVASDKALSGILWEKEGSLNSLGEVLDLPLQPYTRYYYQITVRSDAGEEAKSDIHYFETAKLSQPWRAKWIGVQGDATHPEFFKAFELRKDVQSARLYICGLGIFEASINGQKAGNDLLAPFINDYEEHYQYCTYDVTDLLKEQNELSVLLGDGWYRGHFGLGEPTHYDRPLALIAELRIVFSDGSVETICTDESWQYRRSFTTLSDIYNGEAQDHTLPLGDWQSAVVINALGKLCERYSPALHYMESFPVKEVIHTPAGETVLDFGQNFAGHVICTQELPAGTTMTLEFGEVLQNGNFYHDNYRNAESKFTYVSDGICREIRPRFTFFGFRYVKVSGLDHVDASCFEGRAIYSEMDQTGFVHTGNEKINQLFSNSLWGLKSNFLDMPTDCPQRDERVGWTGDAQVFCTTAGFHMDTRAFYHKFLRDLRSDQKRNNGAAAIYLPNAFPSLTAGIWSDVATFMPKMLYDYYGSRELLAEHYPLMKDWVDYVYRADQARGQKNLYDFGFQFGDWLALDGSTEQSTYGRTDNGYLCSMYYWASTRYVADAAKALGLEEAVEYEARAEAIKAAILAEYFTVTGRLAIDTQTGYLAALKFGVYKDKQRIIDGLKDRMKKDLNRLKGGFVGSTMMNCVLAENGMVDKAYDFLFYEGFPGWLYAVNLGATTIWERWNSILPDGSISGTGMNSLNHYSYGSVVEFLYRYSAGIQPTAPGFQKAKIAPQPEIRLGHMACSFDSASGKYVSNWNIEEDGSLTFHIEIPFECEAEVSLPEQESKLLTAGSYDFQIRTQRDYRALYSGSTPYERLFEDDRAVAVLKKYVPEIVAGTDRTDAEAMSKCLNDSRYRAQLFRMPTEAFDKAIREIETIRS